ncbi:hypothetical protein Scep_027731 [Stephania cephalantha]|uniref:Uncharacterized protein n=1 Tax=Stephania cephalantha TaxID=152367 RepID=A0AAP0HIS8_9MAGN
MQYLYYLLLLSVLQSKVGVYLSDIIYFVHIVVGVLEMSLSGSEANKVRKGKRKLEDIC